MSYHMLETYVLGLRFSHIYAAVVILTYDTQVIIDVNLQYHTQQWFVQVRISGCFGKVLVHLDVDKHVIFMLQ